MKVCTCDREIAAGDQVYVCGWCHRPRHLDCGAGDELLDLCDVCAMLFLPLYDLYFDVAARAS